MNFLLASSNPYYGQDFWGFLALLGTRLWAAFSGQLTVEDMAIDELQVLVLSLVAISSSLVGCFLVLRKMTMLANSLSHTILLGIVLAYLLSFSSHAEGMHGSVNIDAMLVAALITGLATTFLTEFLTKVMGLQEDASTGLVFTSLFALGIILLTMFSRNAHIGSEVVMGSADALMLGDLKLVAVTVVLNLVCFGLFFKEYQVSTFDPGLARVMGISTTVFNYLLMAQVSATVIGAFRAVGVLMVLAMITGPALTARLLTNSLLRLLGISALLGVVAAVMGVGLSRHLLSTAHVALSTSGLVVCSILFLYTCAVLFSPDLGLIARAVRRRRQRQSLQTMR